jgi:hypothetical protein
VCGLDGRDPRRPCRTPRPHPQRSAPDRNLGHRETTMDTRRSQHIPPTMSHVVWLRRDLGSCRLSCAVLSLARLPQRIPTYIYDPRSVISAYESGRRQPGLATLRRLVEASGQVLAVDVVATRLVVLPNTALGRVVSRHRSAVRSVAARYGATTVRGCSGRSRGVRRSPTATSISSSIFPKPSHSWS